MSHKKAVAERFWAKVSRLADNDACWEWTAATSEKGYGRFSLGQGRSPQVASRLAWELTNGPIPDGLCVLHICDNPPCCNPAHLFLGTTADNNADMLAKGRHRSRNMQGDRNPHAALSWDDVREIRRVYVRGSRTLGSGALARRFGVSDSHILAIISGRAWQELGESDVAVHAHRRRSAEQ